jgi:hypothetical protein
MAPNATNASTAATAPTPTASATAVSTAAVSTKWPADRPNTSSTTRISAAILIAGRA